MPRAVEGLARTPRSSGLEPANPLKFPPLQSFERARKDKQNQKSSETASRVAPLLPGFQLGLMVVPFDRNTQRERIVLRSPRFWTVISVLLFALTLYGVTLHPGLPGGDSGELISAAHALGIAHPPGYPLYTVLGKAFAEVVPIGSIAVRLNLFSALTHALALVVLAVAVTRATGSPTAGAISSCLLAANAPFWKYSLVAEVFALNDLFVSLLLLALTAWVPAARLPSDPPRRGPILGIGLLLGLMVTHHHTLALVAIPTVSLILALQWSSARRRLGVELPGPSLPGGRNWIGIGLAIALGLLPLLYLPWAASGSPPLNWDDPRDLRSFVWLLMRGDYGTFSLAPESKGLQTDVNHFALYLESILPDFGWIAGVFIIAGILSILRKERRLWGCLLLGAFALLGLFFSRVQFPLEPAVYRGVVERFYLLPNMLIALLIGFGVATLLPRLRTWWSPAPALLCGAAILAPVCLHGSLVDQRGNTFCRDLGTALLGSVPANGVLFTRGDLLTNTVTYLQVVEGARPDVILIDQELMTYDWYIRGLRSRHPGLLPRLDRVERLTFHQQSWIGRPLASPASVVSLDLGDRILQLDRRLVANVSPLSDGRVQVDLAFPELIGTSLSRDDRAIEFRTLDRSYGIDPAIVSGTTLVGEYPYAHHPAQQRRQSWAPLQSGDRYSGLPGTENIHWFDHLIDRRPICLAGYKDTSFQSRYVAAPHGLVTRIRRATEPDPLRERLMLVLNLIASSELESFFRDYDPWSFEHANKHRFHQLVLQGALLLAHPEGRGVPPDQKGVSRVRTFLERELVRQTRTGDQPPWWLDTRRGLGLLLAAYPPFEAPQRAASLLREFVASAPEGADGEGDVKAMLDYLQRLGY